MTDYIRRDDALFALRKAERGGSMTALTRLERAYAEIREMPAADVAEVVRCENCEFSRELTKTEKRIWLDECRACESPEASQDGYMIVFPEHFCSYGRRRGGGNDHVSD